jgi:NitT/TauT family transport system substrate-binding protein
VSGVINDRTGREGAMSSHLTGSDLTGSHLTGSHLTCRHLTRRGVLAAGAGLALSVTSPRPAHPQNTPAKNTPATNTPTTNTPATNTPATWAYVTPGFTGLVIQYIIVKGLAQKHNVALAKPTEYSAVASYYDDFAAGKYDICVGSWDVLASQQQAGVPIKLLCTITTADMIFILSGDRDITKPAQLKGRTLAAVKSTGTFRIVSALIQDAYGLELGKDVAIQAVDNPAAAVAEVTTNRADAGLSWEPNISAGLARDQKLHLIFNAGEAYRTQTNLIFPYFAVAVRQEWAAKNPDSSRGLRQLFASCLAGLTTDTVEAVKSAGDGTGFSPEVLADAITSRRLRFVYGSMTDEAERRSVVKASEFLVHYGLMPKPVSDDFFLMS